MKIILASGSPYRKKALQSLGIDFAAEKSGVDESAAVRKNPKKLALFLARKKAEAVAARHKEGLVIGCDSLGFFRGAIMEKPKNARELIARLKVLSGRKHQFITAVCVIDAATKKSSARVSVTDVYFRVLSNEEIKKYPGQDSNFRSFAVGYDPQNHISATFIKKLDGSYHNVISGLPVEMLAEMLGEFGYKL